MNEKTYWLTNVRLETGYQFENEIVVATNTDIFHIQIMDGKIVNIVPEKSNLPIHSIQYDVKRALMLPSFRDMHIHLDKTYYGGPWKAPRKPIKGIISRLEEEEELIPKLQLVSEERAKNLLDLLISSGTTYVRTHCNVDTVSGLKNLEATLAAKEAYKDKVNIEIVAFPQQGLLRSQSVNLVRKALRNGADLVGGVDPATLDNDMERSLSTVMDLAVEANSSIDLHIHDRGDTGIQTFKRLAELTDEAGWQGKVTISHALALADISKSEAEEVAQMLAEQKIDITSSVPLGNTIPIPLLKENFVKVSLGDDSITDHWSPFGKGDSLEKLGTLAERFNLSDEFSLSQSLNFITGEITPLKENGDLAWPKVGNDANFVFVEASCAAEAVARRSKRLITMYQGKVIYNQMENV